MNNRFREVALRSGIVDNGGGFSIGRFGGFGGDKGFGWDDRG